MPEELVEVGQVRKTHGYAGEVKLSITEGHEADVEAVEFIFVGASAASALPYEILGLRGADWICRLEGVSSKEAAAKLRGMPIWLKRSQVTETPALAARADANKMSTFVGFALIDTTLGEVGQIVGLDDNSLQTLARVSHGGREVLVPLSQELIVGVDYTKRILFMDLPEGLLDL